MGQIANGVAAEISEAIVVWVSLADLQGKELEPYLFDNWLLAAIKRIGKAEATAEIKDDFLAQFNAERVWLVLDGADEMAVGDENPLAEIQRQIRTGGCIQKARIVLSCRLNVWDAIGTALDTFDTYRTLEFSYPEQVEMFIDKWFRSPPNPPFLRGGTREGGDGKQEGETLTPPLLRGAGGDLSQQLREALAASGKERIRDLVKNPLRCSLLCGTWQSLEGDLPDTKAKLYRRFVTTLYQWKKPRLNWIQQQELNAALGKLALSGMLNETSRFQLPESVGYRVMGASQFELACRLGWLNLVARDGETLEGIYAFYHPTFQEYFAALAVEDWHFFLNHIPENPQHPDARYRIFEKQWKEVILLWLGREEVGKEEKEAFIEALVEFDDGCGEFYKYRAYFLAAAGIAEFTACSRADEIVSQIIKWGFAYFNEEKQKGRTFLEPIAEGSREILKETDRERAISTLVELINTSENGYTWWHAAKSLGIIGQKNPVAIADLVEFIGTCQDELIRRQAAKSLGIISPNNPVAIVAVSGLKDCLISEINENDYNRYENYIRYEIRYKGIWDCAQNMTYPEFYQAWHTPPTNSPIPDRNHPQNTDIPTILKQLQPTDKTFPVPLNIRALEGETDTSAIAQELCTQLYQAIFPADTDIPAIRNAPEFKRLIPQLKNRLQKQHIALILHSSPCEDALSSLGRKLADAQIGIHIAWITDTPLELPLTGFPVDGDDLLDAVQNWIGGIGS